jgi:hypothetical protein
MTPEQFRPPRVHENVVFEREIGIGRVKSYICELAHKEWMHEMHLLGNEEQRRAGAWQMDDTPHGLHLASAGK